MHSHKLPYYAVIFTSLQTDEIAGYEEMAGQMVQSARQQDGFLGIESVRNGVGITVSYWRDKEAISKWKQQWDHLAAQQKGRDTWYQWYKVEVCKVERSYDFVKNEETGSNTLL